MIYISQPTKALAFQWNPVSDGKPPMLSHDFIAANKSIPEVRATSYMEVHTILKTSGCSKKEPYWDWSVLGVIDTDRGPQVLSPGDWVVVGDFYEKQIFSNSDFERNYAQYTTPR